MFALRSATCSLSASDTALTAMKQEGLWWYKR